MHHIWDLGCLGGKYNWKIVLGTRTLTEQNAVGLELVVAKWIVVRELYVIVDR